ncbi:MAG: hypothetical protein ACYC38_13440, partial [Eubacteriales bacterium]
MDRNRADARHLNTDNRIQINLDSLVVRPITQAEENTWNNLMREHHYLGFHSLTGKTLKYVALLDGHWVALVGWGSATFKSSHREKWIG